MTEAVKPTLTSGTAFVGQDPLDWAIRHDCELLWDWLAADKRIAVWGGAENRRRRILAFVLNRHGVTEWPDWAGDWVEGDVRPCAHAWQASEEGIRCGACGEVAE